MHLCLFTPAAVGWLGYLPMFVCFPDNILKIDAARITKLDAEMFYDKSGNPIYFGIKR